MQPARWLQEKQVAARTGLSASYDARIFYEIAPDSSHSVTRIGILFFHGRSPPKLCVLA